MLSFERDKYFGGGLGECLFKIKLLNLEDIGKYICIVVYGFGLILYVVILGIVNFFIIFLEMFINVINFKLWYGLLKIMNL